MSTEPFGELDDLGFLREADLFRDMADEVIRAITVQAHTLSYGAGDAVVRKGDPGVSFFVVKSGVVEVVDPADENPTPLAYLGRGECFGELALLTGSARHADVRVPEFADLLVIDQELFDDLIVSHPGFGRQLCVILARRLINLLQRAPDATKKQLEGNLRYFDLATVVQTLIASSQTGVMTFSSENKPVAHLFFQTGNIFRARYGHRSGDEAVHQLFQEQPSGEFQFVNDEKAQAAERPDTGITVPAMALMMESVRLQDELQILKPQLPPPLTPLQCAVTDLNWVDKESAKEARDLWTRLERPMTVTEIFGTSGCCHFHVARILLRLLETRQVQAAPVSTTS